MSRAGVDRRAGRIDDQVGAAEPAGVAADTFASDRLILERDARGSGSGDVCRDELANRSSPFGRACAGRHQEGVVRIQVRHAVRVALVVQIEPGERISF
jgi:hypothetical protein